jgi:hypothetical protein
MNMSVHKIDTLIYFLPILEKTNKQRNNVLYRVSQEECAKLRESVP